MSQQAGRDGASAGPIADSRASLDGYKRQLNGMLDSLQAMTETAPRAAAAFFYAMVQVFMERLRRSTQQVAEATRWGLEATGLDVEAR